MKKITRQDLNAFFKSVDYCHYICIGITLCFVLLIALVFPHGVLRLGEAFRDLGLSLGYFFSEMFGFRNAVVPSVTSQTEMPFTLPGNFPETWEEFKVQFSLYWQTFANEETFFGYFRSMRKGAIISSFVLTLVAPSIIAIAVAICSLIRKKNNRYNEDTKPLKAFKKLSDKTYRPIKARIISFCSFVKEYRLYLSMKQPKPGEIKEPAGIAYWEIWLFIAFVAFNIFTIFIEAIAYYFYFAVSFDVASLFGQVYKLLLDLSVVIKFIPTPVLVLIVLLVIGVIRKKIGYDRLYHLYAIDCGFIKERGVFSLIVAPMRKGKGKFSVSMALTRSAMFRDMAYEILLRCDLKFPYFPWINFERSLRKAMDSRAVINLATCRRFVRSKMRKFYKHREKRYIFGYDFKRYGLTYDNAKNIETLEEVLSNYAQAYFIYIIQSSLILSNFSIREDSLINDIGNFPIWQNDFFEIKSKEVKERSRFSHIIDYDALRLGKKLIKESKFGFEFGVIDITEIAKERLNMLELQGLKKEDPEVNQKNDGFDDWVKMCGHSGTVDYTCFVSIYADDQREDNLSAGLREIGEILRVEDVEKDKLAMPFFFIGELIYALSNKIMNILHKKERFNKGNNTLLYYVLHTIGAKIESHYRKVYNIFGYELFDVSVQDGAKNNDSKRYKYYVFNKKDLADRYATDCLGDTLAVRILRATWGLDDQPSYGNVRSIHDENMQQKSFFVTRLDKYVNDKSEPEISPAFSGYRHFYRSKWH